MAVVAPYGAWKSPISAAHVAAAGGTPHWVEQQRGEVWWTEGIPAEDGRVALLRSADGKPTEVLHAPWNVRNRVHEYGGRPWTPAGPHTVVFTHWDDQRVYRADLPRDDRSAGSAGGPVPISPAPDRLHGLRYAGLTLAPGGAEVWAVRETVTGDAPTDLRRDLVAIPLNGSARDEPERVRVLAASHHLMSEPKPSPDGRRAAWIGWDHPAMPWDGTRLCVAEVDERGRFGRHRVLAGGPAEAVCQVEWDGPDHLLALTDPDGWWNLYRIGLDGTATNLAPVADELGGALWRVGLRWFAPLGGGRHAVLRGDRLAVLDEATGTVVEVAPELPVWYPTLSVAGPEGSAVVAGTAASPTEELAVVCLDLASGRADRLRAAPAPEVDPAYLPLPAERAVPVADGARVPAYVFPPTNPDFVAPDGELPPYIVHVHGGPTGRSSAELDLEIAFFTSRGFGVVLPNYGGSTGYGRAFRERLREQWGVVDVEDCAAVAAQLAAEGLADPDRMVVRGGSAGGWTTAASLTRLTTYRCGTAQYPILDLLGWATGETHDFESRYLEGLVGPLPQARERYLERSPSTHPHRLTGPILLLQGLDDQICPPVQADRFVAALAGSGLPHAYLTFPGEQHGFRKADTIQAALEAELSFYGTVLGFDPPGVPRLQLRS